MFSFVSFDLLMGKQCHKKIVLEKNVGSMSEFPQSNVNYQIATSDSHCPTLQVINYIKH